MEDNPNDATCHLHFKATFFTSATKEMNKITVSNSKVDANLHSPTTYGGPQDSVGSTLPISPSFIQTASDDSSSQAQFNNLDSGEVVVLPRRASPPRSNGTTTHFKSECEKLSSWIKSEKTTAGDTPVKWKACVPVKDGFTEFVRVDKKKCKLIGGFSTEVFCAALQIFPYKVELEFVPLADHNCEASQNYSDIILTHVGQAYTANLSSIFTVDQLQPIEPRVVQSVGYQEGSFVRDLLANEYDSNVTLKSYTTIHQYHDALMNKSVDVIYDELPYINLFLHEHGSSHMKVGPIYKRTGFGFAFPFGSPYVPEFSRAVVNVSESKKMQHLMKKYRMHDYSSDDQASQVPQKTPPLDARSFIGLFILAGVGVIGAILASEYAIWQRRSAIVEMTKVSEDLPNVDNQENLPPVSIPSDGEIPLQELDEVEEIIEVLPSQEVRALFDGSFEMMVRTVKFMAQNTAQPRVSQNRQLQLYIELQEPKKNDLSISKYLHKAKSLSDELSAVGKSVSPTEFNAIIYRNIGSNYHSIITTLNLRQEPVSFYEMHSQLIAHEILLKNSLTPMANIVLKGSPLLFPTPPSSFMSKPRPNSQYNN
ncbi:hypothetical protein RJ639_016251 [Escallonia herrerae]|uniref:Ionotropic glutamate receptor C-terminal domain-containing protein n=1 Tax=Escallonia herrerae TaxID=1293975 RepID=A0AA88VEK0_9ASTE|nr:hypothetical protein RJ639_016251 [Escallonia herrerae]